MSEANQTVQRLALWSIAVGIIVLALKTFAWWLTGSIALYSDALESIVNVVASLAAWYAIRVSHMPADKDHPFGHHKAEYFSAVLEGVLIVLAALLILMEVWKAWQIPAVALDQPWEGMAVNSLATAVNFFWAQVLLRAGRKHRSPALSADGRHIMTDVVTSVGVLAGLIGAVLTGWLVLDTLLALVVALNILWQGGHVIASSLNGLMDAAVDTEDHMKIRDIISANAEGALEVHDLKTRIAGRATFIEFHLVVDAGMTVGDAHVICDRIEAALEAEIEDARIHIHVEPEEEAKLPPGTSAVPFA
ncbi:cation diffusion facilitator family transporter [Limoniibacter endophyticus]|uniref:Protein p34 n=1 Tax=Limoniibacter endophyticus TaxID=1565040 RepID=A0A8J3GGK0_9HYPH|nr:cation diffusion facilitator family transporter [Limoniibacter endophyticus]GHC65420.1 cadmium transporter [Limoniibacter endophyticus]